MPRTKSVDDYIAGLEHWQDEVSQLRVILRSLDLEETIKWGAPTYVAHGKNVVGLAAFKQYFGLWFFQGALLSDEGSHLINAQQGKTKAMRQWRFASGREIKTRAIRKYVKEAIELAAHGKAIPPARAKPVVVPPELGAALKQNSAAAASFKKLTKGLRREYADYISEAKRADTKTRRLAKILPMIIEGRGLNDRYR